MIDCQNTYTRGVMELDGVQAALDQAEELLSNARSAGIAIFHVMHDAGPGTPYDVNDEIGQVCREPARRGR
jgi:nicotinamidase-related amidase